jgi:NADH dehydrogenase
MNDRQAGDNRPHVVIVGAGFGGINAAVALARLPLRVTILDQCNHHTFQPLLYQVALAVLSPAEIASPIRAILADQKNAHVVLADVGGVDFEGRRVFSDAGEFPYDWLVLAAGVRTSYFGHDDWEVYAPGLKSLEDALEIRRRVLSAFERAEREPDERERRRLLTFVVIGGGPTGVELAGAVAEISRFVLARDFRSIDSRDAKVILVEAGPRILTMFPEDLAQSAVEQLGELGVEVWTGKRVVGIDERGVEYEDGGGADELPGLGKGRARTRIPSATVVWAAGVRGASLAQKLGVSLDPQGRVIVGQDCAIDGRPEVFAIGDMARFEEKGKVLPGVSPVAMQQGRYVAKLIGWELDSDGRPPREPFWYLDKGSMATIGRSRAITWVRGLHMKGFLAWVAWLFVHIWYLIGFKNRIAVMLDWAWYYLRYKRGARLIVTTGWQPEHAPREAARSPASARPRERAATPPA